MEQRGYRRSQQHFPRVGPTKHLVVIAVAFVVVAASTTLAVVEAVAPSFATNGGTYYSRAERIRRRRRKQFAPVAAGRRPAEMTPAASAPDDYGDPSAADSSADSSASSPAATQMTTTTTTTAAAAATPRPIRAGFVGCGTIAHSIAIGLASSEHASHLARFGLRLASLSVTRRSECRSSDLASRFPGVVRVRDSAREVVRDSDLVFLCVLPDQVDGVLEELAEGGAWREEDHTLVSLVVRVCFPVYISFLPFASSSCPLPPRSSVVHCVINIILSPPYPIIIHSRRPKKKQVDEQGGGSDREDGTASRFGVQADMPPAHIQEGRVRPAPACSGTVPGLLDARRQWLRRRRRRRRRRIHR